MTPPGGVSIARAVQLITHAPAPLLLPDTCALLDVVRAPARNMNYLTTAATRLYDSALVLALDTDCLSRAYTRQAHHQRPGRRGKSINDCVILEHALCLCSELLASGSGQARVFASPNTADYCEGRALHPQLVPEFRAAGMQFVTDLRGARYRLNL
jgi:hypothetical protein